jgi:hypothetical protein
LIKLLIVAALLAGSLAGGMAACITYSFIADTANSITRRRKRHGI